MVVLIIIFTFKTAEKVLNSVLAIIQSLTGKHLSNGMTLKSVSPVLLTRINISPQRIKRKIFPTF